MRDDGAETRMRKFTPHISKNDIARFKMSRAKIIKFWRETEKHFINGTGGPVLPRGFIGFGKTKKNLSRPRRRPSGTASAPVPLGAK